MAVAYLACIASSTGVPLFLRSHGDVPQLSFPVVGSLNGAHWFTSNAKASLLSCVSQDVKIVWKNFHECLTLILVTPNNSPVESHQTYLLDLIFNAMVFMVGLPDLLSTDNVEVLKRDLKCCYPFIDMLIGETDFVSPLTRGVETIYTTERKPLLECLESLTEQIQSGFGCLCTQGRILTATENWWQLDPQEIIILSLFLTLLPPVQCTDIPVYLPKASNTVAHRLLVFQLVEGVQLMVLCDSEPSLSEAQEIVRRVWGQVKDKITGLSLLVPRCLPLIVVFEPNILALCLVNLVSHQTLLALFSSEDQGSNATLLSKGYQGSLSTEQRRKYLVQFYESVVDDLIPMEDEQDGECENGDSGDCVRNRVPHKITETYTSAKMFKAYAIHRNQYNLFVLFHCETPTFALRKMSHDVLDDLIDHSVV